MKTLATLIALNETVVPFGDDATKYITLAGYKDGKAIVTTAHGAPLEIPQSELPSDAGAGTLFYLNAECNAITAYRIPVLPKRLTEEGKTGNMLALEPIRFSEAD